MATKVVDRAVVDTTVLLAATDADRPENGRALALLNDWPTAGAAIYTSGQILREYLCVATRPPQQSGLGMDQQSAVTNVRAFRGRLHFLDENEKTAGRLLELLDDYACSGKQVHDANVVATAIVHGVDTVVTMNVDDFTRFGDRIRVLPL